MKLTWPEFKSLSLSKSALIQFTQSDSFYYLQFYDGPIIYECKIDKNPTDSEFLDDFELNFKNDSNKPLSPLVTSERKQVVMMSMTSSSWHYQPRALDFYTSLNASLYNRKHDGALIDEGSDYGDAWMVFKNSSGNEISRNDFETDADFQNALDASCVMTEVFFEPSHDYEIFGAILNVEQRPVERAYVWVVAVPDVPAEHGGSIPFMGGGMNLKMFPDGSVIKYDAKTGSTLSYNPDYHTNKILLTAKHAAGARIGIQVIYEFYKE